MGNTSLNPCILTSVTVHPHTRGEHYIIITNFINFYGSSPHTWGTPQQYNHFHLLQRFIPTHVGNTVSVMSCTLLSAVHPHTRGEHLVSQLASGAVHGSSPHTWGTRVAPGLYGSVCRFIPTHVGNTNLRSADDPARAVHPHTRGEHIFTHLLQ